MPFLLSACSSHTTKLQFYAPNTPQAGPPHPGYHLRYPEKGEPAGEVTFPQAPIGQGKARGHASPQTDFSVPSGSSGQGGAPSQGTHPNHYPHSPAQGSGENAAGYRSHLLVALLFGLLAAWPSSLSGPAPNMYFICILWSHAFLELKLLSDSCLGPRVVPTKKGPCPPCHRQPLVWGSGPGDRGAGRPPLLCLVHRLSPPLAPPNDSM